MSEVHVAELWDVERVIPYENNAKKHPPEQVAGIAKSMRDFGWTGNPIVVDIDGVIIMGHGRRLAAIENGRKQVPVVCRKDLSKEEAMALRLADNRVSGTEYDLSLIQGELMELAGFDGFDLSSTGFSDHEQFFSTTDLGEFAEGAFVEDIGAAVEAQAERNTEAAKTIDDVSAPVVDALGFKRVTIEQSRTLRTLMGRVAAKTGVSGVEGLIKQLNASLA